MSDQLIATGAQPHAPVADRRRRPRRTPTWRLPIALTLLALIPMFGGSIRLAELASGTQITPDNDGVFITTPIPIVVHIIAASLYSVLGAFQFSAGLRQRRRGWHRASGRVLVPLGLAAAVSALWMTVVYPAPAGTGELLYAARLLFASGMAVALLLGFSAIRRRDVRGHSMWMTRAYAIGLGAGTQVFTLGFGAAIFGEAEVTHDLLMTAAWVLNLLVAECAIHRRGATSGAVGRRKAVELA